MAVFPISEIQGPCLKSGLRCSRLTTLEQEKDSLHRPLSGFAATPVVVDGRSHTLELVLKVAGAFWVLAVDPKDVHDRSTHRLLPCFIERDVIIETECSHRQVRYLACHHALVALLLVCWNGDHDFTEAAIAAGTGGCWSGPSEPSRLRGCQGRVDDIRAAVADNVEIETIIDVRLNLLQIRQEVFAARSFGFSLLLEFGTSALICRHASCHVWVLRREGLSLSSWSVGRRTSAL
mmetsp:Transcript_8464/g.18835  ORF Transcript_8464/g.18835 Transcript_8464/m.18835 type:complete len:235 (-) Transcript_8464:912-1616(-)